MLLKGAPGHHQTWHCPIVPGCHTPPIIDISISSSWAGFSKPHFRVVLRHFLSVKHNVLSDRTTSLFDRLFLVFTAVSHLRPLGQGKLTYKLHWNSSPFQCQLHESISLFLEWKACLQFLVFLISVNDFGTLCFFSTTYCEETDGYRIIYLHISCTRTLYRVTVCIQMFILHQGPIYKHEFT